MLFFGSYIIGACLYQWWLDRRREKADPEDTTIKVDKSDFRNK